MHATITISAALRVEWYHHTTKILSRPSILPVLVTVTLTCNAWPAFMTVALTAKFEYYSHTSSVRGIKQVSS
jgi:hypothetical protein